MSFGDISFIAAFIVLPLVVVALSVMALRTLNQRQHRPIARFRDPSVERTVESTQELPVAGAPEPRDWAASVRPTRGPVAEEQAHAEAPTQAFKVPTYRGRTKGVVRRMSFRARPIPRGENTKPAENAQRKPDPNMETGPPEGEGSD